MVSCGPGWSGGTAARPTRTDTCPTRNAISPPGAISVRGRPIQVVDLVAATLRRVAEQAAQVGGQPADEVVLTVPAAWGPNRRTLLRRAASRAGLPQPHLVDTPVAVATHLHSAAAPVPVQAAILLCDFGAGRFEATVLSRTGGGFEVLSTIDTTHASGLAVDTTLADHLAALTTTPKPTSPDADAGTSAGAGQGRRFAAGPCDERGRGQRTASPAAARATGRRCRRRVRERRGRAHTHPSSPERRPPRRLPTSQPHPGQQPCPAWKSGLWITRVNSETSTAVGLWRLGRGGTVEDHQQPGPGAGEAQRRCGWPSTTAR